MTQKNEPRYLKITDEGIVDDQGIVDMNTLELKLVEPTRLDPSLHRRMTSRSVHMNSPEKERAERMQRMKDSVKENNIYNWASKIISALLRIS